MKRLNNDFNFYAMWLW